MESEGWCIARGFTDNDSKRCRIAPERTRKSTDIAAWLISRCHLRKWTSSCTQQTLRYSILTCNVGFFPLPFWRGVGSVLIHPSGEPSRKFTDCAYFLLIAIGSRAVMVVVFLRNDFVTRKIIYGIRFLNAERLSQLLCSISDSP